MEMNIQVNSMKIELMDMDSINIVMVPHMMENGQQILKKE
jgi:hypothetical protein